MFTCPRCQESCASGCLSCPACHLRLNLLVRAHELPTAQFNAALDAVRSGQVSVARSLIGAVLAARPTDAEAWLLAGHIHVAAQHWDLAKECWDMATLLKADDLRAARAASRLAQWVAESTSHGSG